jgi:hypothetical protein
MYAWVLVQLTHGVGGVWTEGSRDGGQAEVIK